MSFIIRISRQKRWRKLTRMVWGHFVSLIKTSLHIIECSLGHKLSRRGLSIQSFKVSSNLNLCEL